MAIAGAFGAKTWDASQPSCAGNEYFPFAGRIPYKGPTSTEPYAYRWYNKHEVVAGKPMSEWLRFAVAFWHSFRGDGSDMFGSATKAWPWHSPDASAMENAESAMRANFELLDKLGVDYWCFHDRDIAPKGATLRETNANLDAIVAVAEKLQLETGARPLWGTAQLFKDSMYAHGAATSPSATAFAHAAAQARDSGVEFLRGPYLIASRWLSLRLQVKKAMEVTQRLGGLNYVLWGGREGYTSLLNTDMELELQHLATFLRMTAAYKKRLGFNGTLLLEPKPKEPTIHQYDWDVATTLGFLRAHGLEKDFAINVECNHAQLAGHSCEHELETARIAGALGNVDANTGDALTGWDTDEFLTVRQATALCAGAHPCRGCMGAADSCKARRTTGWRRGSWPSS